MPRTTISYDGRHEAYLEQVAEEIGGDEPASKADAAREIFDRAMHADELADRIDELEHKRDELQRQLAAANTRIDASNELVRYVEEEKRVMHRRERREDLRAHAGIVKRAKWFVTGMPEVEDRSTPDVGSGTQAEAAAE